METSNRQHLSLSLSLSDPLSLGGWFSDDTNASVDCDVLQSVGTSRAKSLAFLLIPGDQNRKKNPVPTQELPSNNREKLDKKNNETR